MEPLSNNKNQKSYQSSQNYPKLFGMMPVQRTCTSITLRTSHAFHFVQDNADHGQAAQSRTIIYSTPVAVVIRNAAIRTTYNALSAPNFGRTYIGHRQPPCCHISFRTSTIIGQRAYRFLARP